MKTNQISKIGRYTNLLFIVTLFGLLSCEEKKDTAASSFSIVNVTGPSKFDCGSFKWSVRFSLPQASPKGGYIIQQITTTRKATKSCPKPYTSLEITFYEAWKVNAGESVSYDIKNDPEGFDDNFASLPWDQSEGFEITKGKVRFFEDFKMTPDWTSNNPRTCAGEIPSTLTKPAGWDDKDAVDHNLSTEWKCCGTSTQTLTTEPSFPEIIGKVKSPLGGKFIGSVECVPAWTHDSVYSPNDNLLLRQYAMIVTGLSDNEIRTGVGDYTGYYAGDLDAMSKLLLMLRMVYNVPDSVPMEQAKSFGSWIRPVEELSGSYYKIGWPVVLDPVNGPMVKYPYMGYLGAPYNAPGELDYFINTFGRRQL